MTQKIFAAQSIKPLPERRGRLRRHKTWMTASIIGTVLSALIAQYSASAEPATFNPPKQRLEPDLQFEACAMMCQNDIDRALANCPGYREVLRPLDRSPAPARCRRNAIEANRQCLAMCPSPRRIVSP